MSMDFAHQVETLEITDGDLDNVSGGMSAGASGGVSVSPGSVGGDLQNVVSSVNASQVLSGVNVNQALPGVSGSVNI